jgi:DNA-binding transcriptional regulator YdaS (Cro superfamily)
MTLPEYIKSSRRGTAAALAVKCGITKTWMSLIVSGKREPSPELAGLIEVHTEGKVTRKDLRPDIFGALQ